MTRTGRRAVLFAPALARAQMPARPLTLIAPFTPGGPIDILARTLAQGFQARTGQPAAVDNRAGGAGNIGIDLVRRAPPDGTTMLVIPAGNLTINPTLLRNLSFDVERDFAPVSMMATTPNLIIAAPGFAPRNVAELVAAAKAQPGRITYGSPGVGSQLHLAMELLRSRADIDIQHVPYRGTTQALTDLLGGQLQLLASNLPVALPVVTGRPGTGHRHDDGGACPCPARCADAGRERLPGHRHHLLVRPAGTPRDAGRRRRGAVGDHRGHPARAADAADPDRAGHGGGVRAARRLRRPAAAGDGDVGDDHP